jgi:hypothetical protein
VHGVDHGDDMVDWSFRQDAMAEVENMSGPTSGAPENFRHSTLDFFGGANNATGSRLPCTATSCPTAAQPSSRLIRQSSPITSPPAARMLQ